MLNFKKIYMIFVLGLILTSLLVSCDNKNDSSIENNTDMPEETIKESYTEELRFELNQEGTEYKVTGIIRNLMTNYEQVIIPSTYNGKPVTMIADEAFENVFEINKQQ